MAFIDRLYFQYANKSQVSAKPNRTVLAPIAITAAAC